MMYSDWSLKLYRSVSDRKVIENYGQKNAKMSIFRNVDFDNFWHQKSKENSLKNINFKQFFHMVRSTLLLCFSYTGLRLIQGLWLKFVLFDLFANIAYVIMIRSKKDSNSLLYYHYILNDVIGLTVEAVSLGCGPER